MIEALGMYNIHLCVSKLICREKFFVTYSNLQDVPIILVSSWQNKYNCFLEWQCRLAHCKCANRLWVPLCQPKESYVANVKPTKNSKLDSSKNQETL